MTHSFWRYRAFLRQALREELVYKERVFLLLFNVALRIATQLFFWSVVYRQTSRIAGFNRDAIFTYVFMTTALTFLFSGVFHRKMVQSIMDGSISMDLARPIDLYVSYLFAYVGQVIFNLLSYVPIIVVGGVVLAHLRGPRTAAAWLLFLASLALGVLLWHSVRWLFSLIPLFHLIAERVEVQGLGLVLSGCAILLVCGANLRLHPSAWTVLFFVVMILCGGLLYLSLLLICATATFWLIGVDTELMFMVVSFNDFARFPLTIFPGGLRFILTWLLPYAFTGFFPATFLMGTSGPSSLYWAVLPLTATLGVVAYAFWVQGLRRYQSSGV